MTPKPKIRYVDDPKKSERETHLELALSAVLEGYGRAMVTIPKTSLYYAAIEGAMEKAVAMAARVLAK